jgi:hypothetical protein
VCLSLHAQGYVFHIIRRRRRRRRSKNAVKTPEVSPPAMTSMMAGLPTMMTSFRR